MVFFLLDVTSSSLSLPQVEKSTTVLLPYLTMGRGAGGAGGAGLYDRIEYRIGKKVHSCMGENFASTSTVCSEQVGEREREGVELFGNGIRKRV